MEATRPAYAPPPGRRTIKQVNKQLDPREILSLKTQADAILERAAIQLRELLREACAKLDPFPPFPNALFTNAIECDPGPAGDPERGCVVVCEDGELYELEIGIDHEAIELTGSWDPVTARKETKKKLELHPRDEIVYAYNGLLAVIEALLERAGGETAGADQRKRP